MQRAVTVADGHTNVRRGNEANNGTIAAMAGMCMARMACPWCILCPVRRLGPLRLN